MFQRVVVALDGSALGEAILPQVRRLLDEDTVQVWLVHALVPNPEWMVGYAPLGSPMPMPLPPESDPRALGQAYLDRVVRELGDDRRGRVHTLLREGEPASVLAAAAAELDADLIAMSTHGRTGIARLVLGSVTQAVLRRTDRPVLLVRPDERHLAAERPPSARPQLGTDGPQAGREGSVPSE